MKKTQIDSIQGRLSINRNLKSLRIHFVARVTKEIQKIVKYSQNPRHNLKQNRKKKKGKKYKRIVCYYMTFHKWNHSEVHVLPSNIMLATM